MIQGRKNEQKKRGANPDFSFFSGGIGSYMLFRLAKSDAIEHNHKCPITIQCRLLDHRWIILHNQASIMAVCFVYK